MVHSFLINVHFDIAPAVDKTLQPEGAVGVAHSNYLFLTTGGEEVSYFILLNNSTLYIAFMISLTRYAATTRLVSFLHTTFE